MLVVSSRCNPSQVRGALLRTRSLHSTAVTFSSSSDFSSSLSGHGFTGYYEPGETEGPLRKASNIGAPKITPRSLKNHLDQFVVGQERAKKVLSVSVYNHYQRIQELQRQDEEAQEALERQARRSRHPVEDEYPGHHATIHAWVPPSPSPPPPRSSPLDDTSPLTIEKSNIMLLGPSGVGKTLMAKTLARVLDVPFSMSDCTPFTQSGYIGEDADVCVQRLLAAANYDVEKAEHGIICLDEIDKIATAKVSHGKDVGGEGVQQALLKIIEGTTLQIQAKQERGNTPGRNNNQYPTGSPTNSPLSSGGMAGGMGQPPGKSETFNVNTSNILFICTGAFSGLHKTILDRVAKGGIGFGANVRSSAPQDGGAQETTITDDDELIRKHLPYYMPPASEEDSYDPSSKKKKATYNVLDLVEPQDLQKFGMIPELVGRIPISCALSALDVDALVKVLTEPRNSLLKQYEQLFQLSSIELRITSAALYAIAETAFSMGTGARGLRTVLERLLGDSMFETPGSDIKHIALTEAVAKKNSPALYFTRDGKTRFNALIAREEEEWEDRKRGEEPMESDFERRARANSRGGHATTFEEYRQKTTAAGFV
ncbi:ClpX, ATPase regulatory subunit [Aureobasidium pullulans]|uniref:ClpX, ATPase regulatory subunit n=1 Tax=Aureobasidium pullulans TaxID=5580 RepID=A0A4S8W1F7_AURPU|nr:ClpX, ATPase regulatory subunit [Aureobasidium pullulans]